MDYGYKVEAWEVISSLGFTGMVIGMWLSDGNFLVALLGMVILPIILWPIGRKVFDV